MDLTSIKTEDDALAFFQDIVNSSRENKDEDASKTNENSYSIFQFATPAEFLVFLSRHVKDTIYRVMGAPHVAGEYVTFCSPFKALLGMRDETPSFHFRWKDGYWFDNTASSQAIFTEHYPEKRGKENPANGNVALFLAFFSKDSKPIFRLRNTENRSAGFSDFRHDTEWYSNFFRDALAKVSQQEAHRVIHYIHQECLAGKIVLLEDEHRDALARVKPLWAEHISELLQIDTVGYLPREKALIFFYIAPDGNFDFAVHKYFLTENRKERHIHASIFSLVDGAPVFSELTTASISAGSFFFASTKISLSRDKGNLHTLVKKSVVPTERIPSSTFFFAEGEPDAVTIALLGHSAGNFKNQVEDGRIRKGLIREFAVNTENIVFADTGDDRQHGSAAKFARALGNLSRVNGRKNEIIHFDADDFIEDSQYVQAGSLQNNVDITDLITEKLAKVNKAAHENLFLQELLRLRQKSLPVSYEFSTTIRSESVLPIGESNSSIQVRTMRREFLESVALSNTAKMNSLLFGPTQHPTNIGYLVPESEMEDTQYNTACRLTIRLLRESDSFALRMSATSFDCSALAAGEMERGKKCENCPIWAMREDLCELDPEFARISQVENFAKIPTMQGRNPAGSRRDLRMIPAFEPGTSSSMRTKREELMQQNGMACNPKLVYSVETDNLFYGAANLNGDERPITVYFDSVFVNENDLLQAIGTTIDLTGYFARVFVRPKAHTDGDSSRMRREREIIPVFIAISVNSAISNEEEKEKRRKFLDSINAKKVKSCFEVLAESVIHNNILAISPREDYETEGILYATLNQHWKDAGTFSNFNATLAMFICANSGSFVRPEAGPPFYAGFSLGVYGFPSCGKTHLAKVALGAYSSKNLSGKSDISGIIQAANVKPATLIPSGTQYSKYVPPVTNEMSGDFLVIDEMHDEIIRAKQKIQTFDPFLGLCWEGAAVLTGTFAAAANSTTSIAENSKVLPARCPILLLGNLSKTVRDDSMLAKTHEVEISNLVSAFNFADNSALHKRILFMWAYPRESKQNAIDYEEYKRKAISLGFALHDLVDLYVPTERNLENEVYSVQLKRAFVQFRKERDARGIFLPHNSERLAYAKAAEFFAQMNSIFRAERGYELEGVYRRIIGIGNVLSLIRHDSRISEGDIELAAKLLQLIWRDVQASSGNTVNAKEIHDFVFSGQRGEKGEGIEKPWKFPFFRFLTVDFEDFVDGKHTLLPYRIIDQKIRELEKNSSGNYVIPVSLLSTINEYAEIMTGETRQVSTLMQTAIKIQKNFKETLLFGKLFGFAGQVDLRYGTKMQLPLEYIMAIRQTLEILLDAGYLER